MTRDVHDQYHFTQAPATYPEYRPAGLDPKEDYEAVQRWIRRSRQRDTQSLAQIDVALANDALALELARSFAEMTQRGIKLDAVHKAIDRAYAAAHDYIDEHQTPIWEQDG